MSIRCLFGFHHWCRLYRAFGLQFVQTGIICSRCKRVKYR